MHTPSTKVYRQQVQEGFSIPAVIHNGSYFFVDLNVYENGRVDCWNFEDFASFQRDVQRSWVVLNIPNGEAISIHGLGEWRIDHGEWQFDKQTFVSYVEGLIRALNPRWQNIHTHSERRVNGVVIGESGSGTIYKKNPPADFFSQRIDGASINLFYRLEAVYWLVQVNVFADGTLQLARLETPVELTLDELEQLVQQQVVLTEVVPGATVRVYGLGSFTVQQALYAVSARNKLLEIQDMQRTLAGEPTAIHLCREAYAAYAEQPTASRKQALREAYERVPDHLKRYVGDMDVKDIQVRMVLYGEQEIEGWSHYQVAQARGEELPTIGLPKPEAE
ncbi:MAG TPA: hypothetical protein VF690_12295 [Hymenobacter sp.]|jgi:hypothetical protein